MTAGVGQTDKAPAIPSRETQALRSNKYSYKVRSGYKAFTIPARLSFGEPYVDGILPAYTLLITYDTMILAIHLHEFHGLSARIFKAANIWILSRWVRSYRRCREAIGAGY